MLLLQCENLENKHSLNKTGRPCKKMGLQLSFLTYSWSKNTYLADHKSIIQTCISFCSSLG